jgi:primosomal protein N' (replication factor Y)
VAAEVAEWAAGLGQAHDLALTVLGPAPCPLARIQGRWRWHVALKGDGAVLGRVVRYAAVRLAGSGEPRITIDRDPVSLL